ncbi:hypothetical protein J4417_02675 [Candidatus Woesearchaeota archaeon]|nr:hypothetical protein [Candidatus Woesearchaeota archaeon]
MELINIIVGIGIIILNVIPIILKKEKYLGVTIPLSLLIAAIKVLFFS